MIYGVTILFGLVAFILIAVVGACLILTITHQLVKKYHEIQAYHAARKKIE